MCFSETLVREVYLQHSLSKHSIWRQPGKQWRCSWVKLLKASSMDWRFVLWKLLFSDHFPVRAVGSQAQRGRAWQVAFFHAPSARGLHLSAWLPPLSHFSCIWHKIRRAHKQTPQPLSASSLRAGALLSLPQMFPMSRVWRWGQPFLSLQQPTEKPLVPSVKVHPHRRYTSAMWVEFALLTFF